MSAYMPLLAKPARPAVLNLSLVEVASRGERRRFVRFPRRIYRGDRRWVPPLLDQRLAALDPACNPALAGAELGLFLLEAANLGFGEESVGTIAVWIDPAENARQGTEVAWFGGLEVINEPNVAARLLEAAETWASARLGGSGVLRGPVSLDAWRMPGLLVDGFDYDSAADFPYSPPYLQELVEAAGYAPMAEWRTFELALTGAGEEGMDKQPEGIVIRPAKSEDWGVRRAQVIELCEAAGADADMTSAYVPALICPEEGRAWRLSPDLTFLAEVEGQPTAAIVGLPDLRAVLRAADGRWFPLGWLSHPLARHRIRRLWLPPPAVLPEWRDRGIELSLYRTALREAASHGYQRALIGPLPSAAAAFASEALGARPTQTFRLYEKALGWEGW